MNAKIRRQLERRKRRIHRRLEKGTRRKRGAGAADVPVFAASNIHYEIGDRCGAIAHGGIGAFHLLARRIGLIEAIDARLHLLKIHRPYHESDHVLNFAYNALCDGDCLQDIELRRNDEVFLDALGAERIPDPTTAGDFCRRFTAADVSKLIDIINDVRKIVWARQPAEFFETARVDMDGVLVETGGECKQDMNIAYDGTWGYHPLVVSLARAKPERVKEQIVRDHEFKNIVLRSEDVAEMPYRPTACDTTYRLVVVRKNLSVEKGEAVLFDDYRYFFYLTNDWTSSSTAIVLDANQRCNQENLNAQLQSGIRALHAPVDTLESNWAYMVMTALAWNLKAWWALWPTETPRHRERHREEKRIVLAMEFKTFAAAFVRMPCQIVRGGRRLIYRLLSWNRWQPLFFRTFAQLRY